MAFGRNNMIIPIRMNQFSFFFFYIISNDDVYLTELRYVYVIKVFIMLMYLLSILIKVRL